MPRAGLASPTGFSARIVNSDQAMQDDEVVMDVAQRSDADPQGPAVPYILGSASEPMVGSHPR